MLSCNVMYIEGLWSTILINCCVVDILMLICYITDGFNSILHCTVTDGGATRVLPFAERNTLDLIHTYVRLL